MTELEVFKESLDVSRTTLIVSLFVSTASIVFASLEMAFQRSHNVRSVRPLCELSAKADGQRTTVVLRNVGLGPLILLRATLDGADSPEVDLALPPEEGFVLPPLESRALLSFLTADKEKMEALGLVIGYKDIYGHRHEAKARIGSIAAKPDAI
jgi:hypothetical protein